MDEEKDDFGRPITGVDRLDRDLRNAAQLMTQAEARFGVDLFYTLQGNRIRAGNQKRASSEDGEPNALVDWVAAQNHTLEKDLGRALAAYASASIVGRWAESICGIGPTLAAGLAAHIAAERWSCANPGVKGKTRCTPEEPHGPACVLKRMETAGQLWAFAGLDPTKEWKEKAKRPWNARLKVLAYKVGESFVKVRGRDTDVYGRIIFDRKCEEWERNVAGEYADQAIKKLTKFKISKDTDAYAWYAGCVSDVDARRVADAIIRGDETPKLVYGEPDTGKRRLPPAHIHARARRYGVKLFFAAYHEVLYFTTFGKMPPKPYALDHLKHAHYIAPPNSGMIPGLVEAQRRER